jgi:hypothetical protein
LGAAAGAGADASRGPDRPVRPEATGMRVEFGPGVPTLCHIRHPTRRPLYPPVRGPLPCRRTQPDANAHWQGCHSGCHSVGA